MDLRKSRSFQQVEIIIQPDPNRRPQQRKIGQTQDKASDQGVQKEHSKEYDDGQNEDQPQY